MLIRNRADYVLSVVKPAIKRGYSFSFVGSQGYGGGLGLSR